jgi:NDP-hexose-3-ketoreductase
MSVLRVAVWGLGPHAAKNILPAVAACSGLELAGAHSRSASAMAEARAQFGGMSWGTPDAMLADAGVDAVYVATPIALHAAHGEAVLRAGKHLWSEKPIVTRAAEADAFMALARPRQLVVAEAFMYLYHPQFRYIRDVLDSGRLGRIGSVVCRFGIPPLDRPGFRTDPALGGGAFLDVGSYPISAVTSLFPDADPEVSFSAIVVPAGSAIDTAGRALLRFDEDVSALLEWRINSAYRSEIDIWGTAGSMATELVFSKPADYEPRFRFLDGKGRATIEAGRAANHFVTMLEAFRDLVHDAAAAENERTLIARRAHLVDRIRSRSTHSEVK